ncbi:MAG: PAS domain-containing protein, partial [Variovorax sp.]|nr:PAS domain-containing protein [Variovorax sp.]
MAIELSWHWAALISVGIVALAVLRFRSSLRAQRRSDALNAILDAVPHALFVKDSQLRYKALNAEFERVFRVDSGRVIGRRDQDVFGAEHSGRSASQDGELMVSGVASTYEDEIAIDGVPHNFQSRKQPIFDQRGRFLGLVGVSIDVTAELRIRRQLEQSRADLELALSIGGLGVWRSVARLRKHDGLNNPAFLDSAIHADRRIREICAFDDDEPVTYRQLFMRVHPQDRQPVAARLQEVYRQRRGAYRKQFRICTPDGGERTLEVRGSLSVRNDAAVQGAIVSFTGIVKDVTEEEALKASLVSKAEEARSAVDAKAHFLAMMSHEVRTPLNGVLG